MLLAAIGARASFATLVYLPSLPLAAAKGLLFLIGFCAFVKYVPVPSNPPIT